MTPYFNLGWKILSQLGQIFVFESGNESERAMLCMLIKYLAITNGLIMSCSDEPSET